MPLEALQVRPPNPVVRRILAIEVGVLAVTAVLYSVTGLAIAWRTVVAPAAVLALLFAVWVWYACAAARGRRPWIADTLLATLLLVLFTNIGGPAQYAGVAAGFPLVDPWLAAVDASLGIHVPALAEWTSGHPYLALALVAAYFTLLPQFVLPLVVLGLFYRNREAIWEYVFHFHVCLTVTLAGVMLLPAACAFTYYGFTSLIDQTRFISHFEGLRDGTLTHVRFDDIEGLISFPSFHVAGGMMVTWAFRGYRRWLAVLCVLNAALISATVLTGAHYGIDLLLTLALFAGSVALWRTWGRNGMTASAATAGTAQSIAA